MTMHMDSARSEPTHYNTVQFGDQITVTEITTFGSSLRGNLTFTGGLSVERSGRVADDSLNARDTLGRNNHAGYCVRSGMGTCTHNGIRALYTLRN